MAKYPNDVVYCLHSLEVAGNLELPHNESIALLLYTCWTIFFKKNLQVVIFLAIKMQSLILLISIAVEYFPCAFFSLNCRFACAYVGGMQALTSEYEIWSDHPVKSGTAVIQYMMAHLIPKYIKFA